MPTKFLNNPIGPKGAYSFGGGADIIFAAIGTFDVNGSDVIEFVGAGYTIDTGGGDDEVHGSNADDFIVAGGGSDIVFGGLGNDTIYGGFEDLVTEDSGKGQNSASNTLIGDGIATLTPISGAEGDPVFAEYTITLTTLSSGTFTGGNDTIFGGVLSQNLIAGDDLRVSVSGGATFQGGADTLHAGDGGRNFIYGDAEVIQGTGTVMGGNDTLYAGTGTDDLYGDWQSANGTVTGGADWFVFEASSFGNLGGLKDTIWDFEDGKDKIVLIGTGLDFNDLDTNGDGVLNDTGVDIGGGVIVFDAHVDIVSGTTRIDLGAATGDPTDSQMVWVQNFTDLRTDDFLFDPLIA